MEKLYYTWQTSKKKGKQKKIVRLFKKSYFIFEFGKETWRMRDMDGTAF